MVSVFTWPDVNTETILHFFSINFLNEPQHLAKKTPKNSQNSKQRGNKFAQMKAQNQLTNSVKTINKSGRKLSTSVSQYMSRLGFFDAIG